MTRQSTLPSLREQARHALLLLGVPAPARLVADVHAAFFDGDLSVPALAALMREDERSFAVPPSAGGSFAEPPSAGRSSVEFPSAGGSFAERGDASVPPADPVPAPSLICPALQQDLTRVRGFVTLSTWSLDERLSTPAFARAHALVATVRIAEFAAARPGASASAQALLRSLAVDVPGGPEALDLAVAARAALDDPALAAAAAGEEPARADARARAELLDEHHRLFGLPSVPHQRGGA
jgi:hypothetical protein